MSVDPTAISEWMQTSKSAVELFNTAIKLMPSGPGRDAVEAKVAEATAKLQRSDAVLAQRLGYPLCKCTFPPSIMLENHAQKMICCTTCGNTVSTVREPQPESCSWLEARNG